MKIAVSADCFSAFTSGFPVRGMTLALIKNYPMVNFVLWYTKRDWPERLSEFYQEINHLPNVDVRYFKDRRRIIALKRMFCLKYVSLDDDTDCFLNPGHPEYICNFKGLQICSLADLSTIKGLSTSKHALFFKYWNRFKFRVVLPKISHIVTISNYTQSDLLKYFPELNSTTKRIYNGISSFWFDDIFQEVDLSRWGVCGRYFIWWGLVSRRKNIGTLIRAYKQAKLELPELPNLLIVGGIKDYMSDIRSQFDNNVFNIPFQSDYKLKYLVRNSEGLIFPSLYEGFGLPVIEAFSQGIPVACSNVTSLPEISNELSILFDPNDTNAIKKAIFKLYHNTTPSGMLKNYARQFSYDKAAEQYMSLIVNSLK